jgi:hypothetical protein
VYEIRIIHDNSTEEVLESRLQYSPECPVWFDSKPALVLSSYHPRVFDKTEVRYSIAVNADSSLEEQRHGVLEEELRFRPAAPDGDGTEKEIHISPRQDDALSAMTDPASEIQIGLSDGRKTANIKIELAETDSSKQDGVCPRDNEPASIITATTPAPPRWKERNDVLINEPEVNQTRKRSASLCSEETTSLPVGKRTRRREPNVPVPDVAAKVADRKKYSRELRVPNWAGDIQRIQGKSN